MVSFYVVISFLLGAVIGYLVFYFRYENRTLVDELRNSSKDLHKDYLIAQQELDEYLQQNQILKAKVTELYAKNDDLTQVVSELSRYYYNIKMGASKVAELSEYLQIPDADIERRVGMHHQAHKDQPKESQRDHDKTPYKDNGHDQPKAFF